MDNGELAEFLKGNSNRQHWERGHKLLVNDIVERLGDFNIDYTPDCVYQGVGLRDKGYTFGVVDIAVLTDDGNLVIIEAGIAPSHTRTRAAKNRIADKLEMYSDYFERRFGIVPQCYGVYRVMGSIELKIRYFWR